MYIISVIVVALAFCSLHAAPQEGGPRGHGKEHGHQYLQHLAHEAVRLLDEENDKDGTEYHLEKVDKVTYNKEAGELHFEIIVEVESFQNHKVILEHQACPVSVVKNKDNNSEEISVEKCTAVIKEEEKGEEPTPEKEPTPAAEKPTPAAEEPTPAY